jgi:long-chain fatty acid transport protein
MRKEESAIPGVDFIISSLIIGGGIMSRRRLVYSFLTVVSVLFLSTSAFGAGFALYEGSARGNVLGAGLVASADDPSAVFYNPAGITQLKGKQVQVGFTAITPMMTVETRGVPGLGTVDTDMERNWFFPPHAYYTQQLSDKFWLGVGMFSRFGLGTEFSPAWPGRYNSYQATIQTAEINPNIAWKISDTLSVAGGLTVMWFDMELKRKVPTAAGDVDADLTGDSFGWGLNLALQYKPTDWMQAGISYRSRVSQNLEGDAEFIKPAGLPASIFNNTTVSGSLRLPDMVFAGVNFNAAKNLTIGGGLYWTRWSTYDKLQINYGNAILPGVSQTTTLKEWDDVFRWLIGMEWKVTENWDLRLGYAYDTAPEPDNTVDYILPDNDRHMISVGFGYHKAAWSLDMSYTLMLIKERDYTARPSDGIYAGQLKDGTAHLIGLTLGYKF